MAKRSNEFPKYCLDLLQQVQDVTGVPLALVGVETDRVFEPYLRMTLSMEPLHRFFYPTQARKHVVHYAMTSALKILRIWRAPREQQVVPVMRTDGVEIPAGWLRDLHQAFPNPIQAIGNALQIVLGISEQVTNYPVDLRVERELHADVPRHRGRQREYLEDQIMGTCTAITRPIMDRMPAKVREIVGALHVTNVRGAARIAGVNIGSDFYSIGPKELVDRLEKHYDTVTTPGLAGDREVIDAWAKDIGIENWITWKRLEV